MIPENELDKELWRVAKKRAGFKWSLISYVGVNCLLIAIWFFTTRNEYFWPKWPILGWGIGIVLQYMEAYHTKEFFSAEKEYEKLKNKQ